LILLGSFRTFPLGKIAPESSTITQGVYETASHIYRTRVDQLFFHQALYETSLSSQLHLRSIQAMMIPEL